MYIYDEIRGKITGEVRKDEMLKLHTYMGVGGPADIFICPQSSAEVLWLLKYLRRNQIRYFVMGNGTNLIFSDGGFRGVIIKTNMCFSELKVDSNRIFAGSGVDLLELVHKAAESGLSCIEKLAGIPGSVGGAVWMNAGAFGKEIQDCVEQIHYIDREGNEKVGEIDFSYRGSTLKKGDIIVGAHFMFTRRDRSEILTEIDEVQRRREEKQPLDLPSAGSVFKNPPNKFAGEIIDRLGMKGMRVGDAEISEKHANFIVNQGNASSDDVRRLVDKIIERVRREEGIDLELEVEFVSET
jgi:UDP-N-acetylmuramate dehydrogenase